MAEATPSGETGTPVAPKTEPTAPVAPSPQSQVNAGDASAVEMLKKDLERQQMRINQLENEKKARQEAEDAKLAADLEEQNKFKELYEQERAKREATEAEIAERDRNAELRKAKTELLAEYDTSVVDAAKEFGIDLTDSSEEAKAEFKDKLDKLNTRIANTAKVTPNNPGQKPTVTELSGDQLREVLGNDEKFAQYISDPKRFPTLSQMASGNQ